MPIADSIIRLQCPVCTQHLYLQEKSFFCKGGHHFDIARQGYVHLLPVQSKRSTHPGDDKNMVLARKGFLDKGYYKPIAAMLGAAIKHWHGQKTDNTTEPAIIVDAGCGEGYYTNFLRDNLGNNFKLWGFDVSKPAIIEASKRSREIQWAVATTKNIPLQNHQADFIVSIFSPVHIAEFRRILKPGAKLVAISAGPDHLLELRNHLYPEVRDHDPDTLEKQMAPAFDITTRKHIRLDLEINHQNDIKSLLQMTPHFWRASKARKQTFLELKKLKTRIDIQMTVFEASAPK